MSSLVHYQREDENTDRQTDWQDSNEIRNITIRPQKDNWIEEEATSIKLTKVLFSSQFSSSGVEL